MRKSMYLTGGQAKLDKNKNNKIDAQDFAILRKEKAKGRGKGLQDEKMRPGKVKPVKAVLGLATMGVALASKLKALKKKKNKMPGAAGAGIMPGETAAELYKKKLQGKMAGGMMKKARGGMGAMGGGMATPMSYKKGRSVKVKCKLGRNKPTKMY